MSDINWGLIRSGDTFEDLIRALILFEDPQARLYGRRGRDDGQDARSGDGRIVYQMKFHQSEDASLAIADAKAEVKKIAKYQTTPGLAQEVWQGVEQWILVSNVAFNPRNRQKWIDEVEPLFKSLGLTAIYWEKVAIETLLHKYPDLKQAYFGGETRVFLGIAEAWEQVRFKERHHSNALDIGYQGRREELEQYRNFLLSDLKKILLIHGAGGIGKTRFLLEGAETQALPEGWQVFWANVATMTTTSSWFMGLVVERPTLLLVDEPEDATVLKTLVEQISGGRARNWKVAIAVRSPNDPVLKYVQGSRMRQIVEDLPLASLEESAAIAFCQELLEFGSLQLQPSDWRARVATWIAQHYNCYPIWMVIAIELLERKGTLEAMPQETSGLASEYLEEILSQQQSIPSERILKLLQWTALFDTVNREDAATIELIQAKVRCGNPTELQRYFDSLITRKVIFGRGARNRLLEIRPNVLSDYILRNWLAYRSLSGNWEPSSEALEIVEEVSNMLRSEEASNTQKLLLRGIARFELMQQVTRNPINLLGTLLTSWHERVPEMQARRKLAYLGVLDEISFAHVAEVLSLLRAVLNSTSESETVSTIFGERLVTHDDVILALPWIIYNTARYVQSKSEQIIVLSLLCDLVVAEHDITNRRARGLPNDGKRANTVLSKIITGSPEFHSSFEVAAFEKSNELLVDISSQSLITEEQKLYLETLVKSLLSVEQENTLFDGRVITVQRRLITPDQADWEIRNLLRTRIKEILSERILQADQAVVLWNLLAYSHGELNQALLELLRNPSVETSYYASYQTVLIQDLQWMVNFLNSHNLDAQELTAAREIWNWHSQFDKDAEVKELANWCESFFQKSELFPHYASLLNWESYESLGQWATETSQALITANTQQSIHDFVRNGVKFLGGPDQVSRLFIVAEKLGSETPHSPAARDFVQESLKLDIQDSEFQFATRLIRGWVWTVRQNDSPAVAAVLELLLQWVNTDEKVVQIIQAIYESAWLTRVTKPEVAIVIEQQEHFLRANSAVRFLGLLGGIFFSEPESIKSVVETTLHELDRKQLSHGLGELLKSLNYALRSLSQDVEQLAISSLKVWILDQVLYLPDIDDLSGNTSWYLHELLKRLDKPDLQWLVSAVERRIQMRLELDQSSLRTLPNRERLSQWVAPISSEQANDVATRNLIAQLLSYADSLHVLGYSFPQYLVDIDPAGVITADLVVEKLKDPEVKRNPTQIWRWAKFAGYYPDNSPAWHKIAKEACSLAIQFDNYHQYSIFRALTNPHPKTWIANIGEVPPLFEKAVEIAKQQLESETDPTLIPFRQWQLQTAETELSNEVERVKEEIEE